MLETVLDEISRERNDIKICKVNIDEAEDVSIRYGVMSVPTLMLFRNGRKEIVTVGLKTKDEILEILK